MTIPQTLMEKLTKALPAIGWQNIVIMHSVITEHQNQGIDRKALAEVASRQWRELLGWPEVVDAILAHLPIAEPAKPKEEKPGRYVVVNGTYNQSHALDRALTLAKTYSDQGKGTKYVIAKITHETITETKVTVREVE